MTEPNNLPAVAPATTPATTPQRGAYQTPARQMQPAAQPAAQVPATQAQSRTVAELRAIYEAHPQARAIVAAWPEFDRDVQFADGEIKAILGELGTEAREMFEASFNALTAPHQLEVIRALAGRGRLTALEGGNPATVLLYTPPPQQPQQQSEPQTMSRERMQERIDELQAKKLAAMDRSDMAAAQKAEAEQTALYRALHGSTPLVGKNLRNV